MTLYTREQHHSLRLFSGFPGDLGVFHLCFAAHTLWHQGYPDQARTRIHEALALAQELAHPFSLALARGYEAMLYQFRREGRRAQESAETAISLCTEKGFAYYLAWGPSCAAGHWPSRRTRRAWLDAPGPDGHPRDGG
jgi:adenylate cyclase